MSKIASQEIREAALEAREQGVTFVKIAQVLGKSLRTVQRWAKDYAVSGKKAPAKRGHPPRSLDAEQLQVIEALLQKQPDITAWEIKQQLNLTCHISTISKTIQEAGWRYKKNTQGPRAGSP